MSIDPGLRTRIQEIIDSDNVVLFMKGTRHFPQCGFSATVTQILNQLVKQYKTVNVLTDASVREGIKAYSEWPTIPQLYVKGKFVGGCDIVRELFQSGELQGLIGAPGEQAAAAPAAAAGTAGTAPKISVSAQTDHPSLRIRILMHRANVRGKRRRPTRAARAGESGDCTT